jgi:hypothetical protein
MYTSFMKKGKLRVVGLKVRVRFPEEGFHFALLYSVHNDSVDHQSCYPMGPINKWKRPPAETQLRRPSVPRQIKVYFQKKALFLLNKSRYQIFESFMLS